jgi:hypothetical protein
MNSGQIRALRPKIKAIGIPIYEMHILVLKISSLFHAKMALVGNVRISQNSHFLLP